MIIIIVANWDFSLKVINSLNGASFCQVERVKQLIHDSDAITDGYQKWHGAIPSLINIAIMIIEIEIICVRGWYIILIPSNINIDPRA